MEVDSTTTQLLTLLNVSATKANKRHQGLELPFVPSQKLNKRKTVTISENVNESTSTSASNVISPPPPASNASPTEKEVKLDDKKDEAEEQAEIAQEEEKDDSINAYEKHFGVRPVLLTESAKADVESRAWKNMKEKLGKLGSVTISLPQSTDAKGIDGLPDPDILERLHTPFKTRQTKSPAEHAQLQNDLLSALSTRRDLYLTTTSWDHKTATREAIALHAINHVTRKRRRVLKNNERLAASAKFKSTVPSPEDVQDQGFTRPSVLILLPFRNSALDWFRALTSHTPTPDYQIENQSRFRTEYGLPAGAVDKLAKAEPGTYPRDHVETFKGNVDDNFRAGIKLTKKSVKLFADFYSSDVIFASPLGLRRSIEKEKGADYLSSIEIFIVDQADALTMQNWDHVKYVMGYLDKIPKESHDIDFSRIKPWYLDGHAPLLRQSIVLSAYETPELRALYNAEFKNVAGKIRTERLWAPISVPDGIEQKFVHFDAADPADEADKRFAHFTSQLLPSTLKSAVQSTNTLVFVPSSFDFIRVQNHLRKTTGVSFAVLSEYSTNQEISRARQAFFSGKKSFLLMSERFHFYKRYKIRGIRNILFYGPPDHPQFFTELLSYPFLDDGVEPSDVTCKILYSKFDWFRLERVVGTEAAVGLIKSQ